MSAHLWSCGIDWSRSRSWAGPVGTQAREGKSSAIPGQAGDLGTLSPSLLVLGGVPHCKTPSELELDRRGITWLASVGPLEVAERGSVLLAVNGKDSNPGGTNQRKISEYF